MRIIGVDPGASGALAYLNKSGALIALDDMPVLKVRRGKTDKAEINVPVLEMFARHAKGNLDHTQVLVVFEQVGGITGQSASAAFNFGRTVGLTEATLRSLLYRIEYVTPQVWKKEFGLRGGKDDSRAAATKLWPGHAALFARVKDDGRAEAALIAEWGRRKFGGSNGVFD